MAADYIRGYNREQYSFAAVQQKAFSKASSWNLNPGRAV
jgi:hypothetical protein